MKKNNRAVAKNDRLSIDEAMKQVLSHSLDSEALMVARMASSLDKYTDPATSKHPSLRAKVRHAVTMLESLAHDLGYTAFEMRHGGD